MPHLSKAAISLDRRRFVQVAAAAAVAAPAVKATGRTGPNERLRVGLIGCGGRGRQLLSVMQAYPDVDFPVISDPIEPRMAEAAKVLAEGPRPQVPDRVVEHERILDRKDVDAVLIATTQHCHGLPFIQAAQAGKHIYVEKPLSHTVAEGRAMVDAARKAGIVAVMGTQQRGYDHFQRAVEIVQSGQLGRIPLVECWNFQKSLRRVGRAEDRDPPAGYHWDRWLGPAPSVAFNPARLNSAWWFDYGGGMMTNWAIHHIDIILWAMRAEWPRSAVCPGGKLVVDDMADTPDTIEASWEFPGFVMHFTYRGFSNFRPVPSRTNSHGICFFGTEATLVLDRDGYELWDEQKRDRLIEQVDNPRHYGDGKPGNEVDGPWQRQFVDSIRKGEPLPVDMEESHRATACCQLANIAYLTKGSIRWDARQQIIPDNPQAAALLSRPRRNGYELPEV